MSFTVTTTATQSQERTEVLRLKVDFRESFAALCAKMSESSLIPPQFIPDARACRRITLQSLGLFFVNMLDPLASKYYKDNIIAQEKVLVFHEELQNIIEDHLCPGVTFEAFLEGCIADTDRTLEEEQTEEDVIEKKSQMVDGANDINQFMLGLHQVINQRVRKINDDRKSAVKNLNGQMDTMSERTSKIYSNMQEMTPEFQMLLKRLKEDEQQCLQFLGKLSLTVDKI